MASRRFLTQLTRTLENARHASEWHEAAAEFDRVTGAEDWRAEDDSPYYDARALRSDILTLRALHERGDAEALASALTESLYRHQGELAEPALYQVALVGTKHLVDRYLAACETAMYWLAETEHREVPFSAKLLRFQVAWKVYGRSALLLSGGATLGFHHLGVVKALFEHDLLPDILSGASTGAMIAAGIGARNDAEVADLYANTDQMRLDGLAPVGLGKLRSNGGFLDPARLYAVLRHNIGDRTFAEAHAHSGRTLNISVSATRSNQKPRLLTHLTAPQVLVASAALASSALPGLFPPVELEMRDRHGRIVPYIDGERWTDGSLDGDLPKSRMSRLHNVNHFIVSQTNPHVLPFVAHHGRQGVVPIVGGLVSAAARTQGAYATDLLRRATQRSPETLRMVAAQAHTALTQDYRGNIDIHPRFHWALYKKVVRNPTRGDLARFILEGERSVWPLLARIRNDTRIGRAFQECVAILEKRARRAS
ncbi:MAG: DUF3336 domain-containing protein [Alphaproteobacteria bacterium]|nr:DUF3336 domain-containing protein [Alphaproteobacteria bacterium]